ncbi:NAD(P)-dependent dehydrogenase, short-chain alcohol dehydrogenase family [Streptomyces zhaozhouensis]|uniref:NAD(P)-dependent dehydrogenase, short-chain alcohol dehydrogenase family n=1 Tax=Streptomyces zhaozhouensis TaxID=1300267 RepID=A0A286E3T7_9ACTN|nr:SDR family NAD(P)-dependent oxidoreductase [Streptomyces zhaozhouensis]SOD65577.1 NAD(P)-dependent dehydrogenase, short-chain alcohol dehydrogenase family [Streptomyces zhaozhouensis]
MKRIVVQGGTDGMGRATALVCLGRGDAVTVVGRDEAKGKSFLAEAAEIGAEGRASFIRADLSLISENERVIEVVRDAYPVVDALVLCARHYLSRRRETAEGREATFALFYLSRYLLSHGLRERLEKAERPVILNVAGPGSPVGKIHWEDLEFTRAYDGLAAQMQSGKANDLLGAAFADRHGAERTRYVLINPGSVSTSFSGEYDAETQRHIDMMKRVAKPVAAGIAPIVEALYAPPAAPLSALVEGRPMDVRDRSFDVHDARRLDERTRELLGR